jgi:hypothetical protein
MILSDALKAPPPMILVTTPAASSFCKGVSVRMVWNRSTYDGNSIFANLLKPHILNGASTTQAVHTLALVSANHYVS